LTRPAPTDGDAAALRRPDVATPQLLRDDPHWYKDAIIYQLHVKAFNDSTNDGMGDFLGLTEKLDYIADLGVTAVWLLPFYPSPLRDDGYDIASYTEVHPDYGSLRDFRTFVREAHRRGLRVITELVINHTSDQHPWFVEARSSRTSPKRDWYVWSDTDQKYADARIIFTDTETSNWTWDQESSQYYWHRFFSHQPDLNFDNPQVIRAVMRVMRFWLDLGVDGLRLDAVPYLIERDGTNGENLPETHAVLKRIRAALDARYEGRMLLAEANQWPPDVLPYFGTPEEPECHMAFHFPLMPRIWIALRREDRYPIVEIMSQTPEIPEDSQWALFLRNHDELTLEMVTDEERDFMYTEYAREARMRINVGIRRRLAPLVDNSRRRIELLNSLLFSMKGTPVVYYGDEIGMGDNVYLGDRNGVRTPMQWTGDRNAGFSRADVHALYAPLVADPVYGFQAVNVEAQERVPGSLLNWMKRLIRVRRAHPVFGRGSLEFLHPENRRVLAYLREHDGTTILCVANLSRFAQFVELDLSRFNGRQPIELIGRVHFPRIGELPYLLTLGPHDFFWFELTDGDG
jgi:maltose alpha-D-glucosyltransferase/alpha-amylase